MLITTEGIIIQLRCDEISTYGRITSGVKLINLKNDETVKTIAKVRQTEKVETTDGEEVDLSDNDSAESTDNADDVKDTENDAIKENSGENSEENSEVTSEEAGSSEDNNSEDE